MENNQMPGGLLVGNSHSDGGIKIKTPEGQIEAEGGEVIINKRILASDEKYVCEGTPREMTSKINEMKGGVSWSEGGTCRIVKKAEDGTEVEHDLNKATQGIVVQYINEGKLRYVSADTNDQAELIHDAINDFKDGFITKDELTNTLESYQSADEALYDIEPNDVETIDGEKYIYVHFYEGWVPFYNQEPINLDEKDKAANGKDFSRQDVTFNRVGNAWNFHYKDDYGIEALGVIKKNTTTGEFDYIIDETNGSFNSDNDKEIALKVYSALESEFREHEARFGNTGVSKAAWGKKVPQLKSEDYRKSKENVKHHIIHLNMEFENLRTEYRFGHFSAEEYAKEKKVLAAKYSNYISEAPGFGIYINPSLLYNFSYTAEKGKRIKSSVNVAMPDQVEENEEAKSGRSIMRTHDAGKRPSPSVSATIYPAGYRLAGNDGNMWEISVASNGVHRWTRVKGMEDGTELNASDSPKTPALTTLRVEFIDSDKGEQTAILSYVVYEPGEHGKAIINADFDISFKVNKERIEEDAWDYERESHYTKTVGMTHDVYADDFKLREFFDSEGTEITLSKEESDKIIAEFLAIFGSKIEGTLIEDLGPIFLTDEEFDKITIDVLGTEAINRFPNTLSNLGEAADGKDVTPREITQRSNILDFLTGPISGAGWLDRITGDYEKDRKRAKRKYNVTFSKERYDQAYAISQAYEKSQAEGNKVSMEFHINDPDSYLENSPDGTSTSHSFPSNMGREERVAFIAKWKSDISKEEREKLKSEINQKYAADGLNVVSSCGCDHAADGMDIKKDAPALSLYFDKINKSAGDQDQISVRTVKDGSAIRIYTNNWTESDNENSVNAIHWGKDSANLMTKEALLQHLKNTKGLPAYDITMEDKVTGYGEEDEGEEEERKVSRIFTLKLKPKAANGTEIEPYLQSELKAAGFDPSKYTAEQADLILQPAIAPENYFMDGEISHAKAKVYWKQKLVASGLSPEDVRKAIKAFAADGVEITEIDKQIEEIEAEKDKLKNQLLELSMSGYSDKKRDEIEAKFGPLNDRINALLKIKYPNFKSGKAADGTEITGQRVYLNRDLSDYFGVPYNNSPKDTTIIHSSALLRANPEWDVEHKEILSVNKDLLLKGAGMGWWTITKTAKDGKEVYPSEDFKGWLAENEEYLKDGYREYKANAKLDGAMDTLTFRQWAKKAHDLRYAKNGVEITERDLPKEVIAALNEVDAYDNIESIKKGMGNGYIITTDWSAEEIANSLNNDTDLSNNYDIEYGDYYELIIRPVGATESGSDAADGKKVSKQTGYEIELSAEPNYDFDEDSHEATVNIKPKRFPVKTIQEASDLAIRFIAENDLGSGNWSGGQIYKDGKPYAFVSYNGRVFEGKDGSGVYKELKAADGKKVKGSQEFWFGLTGGLQAAPKGTGGEAVRKEFAKKFGAENMELVGESEEHYIYALKGNPMLIKVTTDHLQKERGLDVETYGRQTRVHLPKVTMNAEFIGLRYPLIFPYNNGGGVGKEWEVEFYYLHRDGADDSADQYEKVKIIANSAEEAEKKAAIQHEDWYSNGNNGNYHFEVTSVKEIAGIPKAYYGRKFRSYSNYKTKDHRFAGKTNRSEYLGNGVWGDDEGNRWDSSGKALAGDRYEQEQEEASTPTNPEDAKITKANLIASRIAAKKGQPVTEKLVAWVLKQIEAGKFAEHGKDLGRTFSRTFTYGDWDVEYEMDNDIPVIISVKNKITGNVTDSLQDEGFQDFEIYAVEEAALQDNYQREIETAEYNKPDFAADGKKIKALLEQIASDFSSFRPDGERGEIAIESNSVSKEFRDLGNWDTDYEDEDYEEGDEEDNDNEVWMNGDVYEKKFKEWASQYPWFKKVDLEVTTGEKSWAYFYITPKDKAKDGKEVSNESLEGKTVRLINMPDDPRPVPAGTLGKIKGVDDAGHIQVRWENGSGLSLIPGVDEYEILDIAKRGLAISKSFGAMYLDKFRWDIDFDEVDNHNIPIARSIILSKLNAIFNVVNFDSVDGNVGDEGYYLSFLKDGVNVFDLQWDFDFGSKLKRNDKIAYLKPAYLESQKYSRWTENSKENLQKFTDSFKEAYNQTENGDAFTTAAKGKAVLEEFFRDKQSGEIVTEDEMVNMVDEDDQLGSFYSIGYFKSKKDAERSFYKKTDGGGVGEKVYTIQYFGWSSVIQGMDNDEVDIKATSEDEAWEKFNAMDKVVKAASIKSIDGVPTNKVANGTQVKNKYAQAKEYWEQLYSGMTEAQKKIYDSEYTRLAKYFTDDADSFNDQEIADYIQGTVNEILDADFKLQRTNITIPFFKLGHKYIAYWNAYKQPEFWEDIAGDGFAIEETIIDLGQMIDEKIYGKYMKLSKEKKAELDGTITKVRRVMKTAQDEDSVVRSKSYKELREKLGLSASNGYGTEADPIVITALVETIDNWGRKQVTRKHTEIIATLKNPESWSDDMYFRDDAKNVYEPSDLARVTVRVGNEMFTVPADTEKAEHGKHLPKSTLLNILKDYLSYVLTEYYKNKVNITSGTRHDPSINNAVSDFSGTVYGGSISKWPVHENNVTDSHIKKLFAGLRNRARSGMVDADSDYLLDDTVRGLDYFTKKIVTDHPESADYLKKFTEAAEEYKSQYEVAEHGKQIDQADYLTNAILSVLDLQSHMVANDNSVTIHGSRYKYYSHTQYNIRVMGDRGAIYNIIPYAASSSTGQLEGASFFALIRQKRPSENFALTKTGEIYDIAENGSSIKTA